ncbi:MAG TPA: OsmC family protein [Caulobacteraceae bacterium]|nr:OsmC family protein [Caulobacteraceae bacterium]
MSEHRATVEWTRKTPGFGYREFNRSHIVRFKDGEHAVAGDAIADFFGEGDGADPEAMFAAAMAACHMLTFLAVASNQGVVVDAYLDEPTAILEKDASGKTAVTSVVLRPKVTFAAAVSPEMLDKLHQRAHRGCFLTNSVKSEISIEPQLDAPA